MRPPIPQPLLFLLALFLTLLFTNKLPTTHASPQQPNSEVIPLSAEYQNILAMMDNSIGLEITNHCLEPLCNAKAGNTTRNNQLTTDEYAKYVNITSNGAINEQYENLPLALIAMFNNLTTTICEQAFTGQNQNPNCGVTTALDVTQLYDTQLDISQPRRFYFYLICINTERVIDGIMAPTYQPSEEPSREPSLEPSIAPSAEPSTSSSPTVTPGERIAVVTQFQLQNSVNIGSEQILGSSEDMEMVEDVYELFVGEVLVEVNRVLSEGRRHLGLRGGSQVSRRLGAEVFLRNVSIGDIADESCPTDQPNNALCQNVNGNINVRVVDIDTAAARATIQSTFNSLLLNDDRFRNIAFTIVPLVPTPLPGSNNVVITPENDGIGVNAIAGIASGAVALGLFAGVALFLSNQRQIRTKNRATNIEEIFARQNDEGITNGGGVRGGLNATLGASTANYGRKGRRASVGDFSSLNDIGDHDGSSTIGTHDHIGDGGNGTVNYIMTS